MILRMPMLRTRTLECPRTQLRWNGLNGEPGCSPGGDPSPTYVPGNSTYDSGCPCSNLGSGLVIEPTDAFVDIDGDGVTDRVLIHGAVGSRWGETYINNFQPPVITTFPNGIAQPTVVEYSVITTAEARALGRYVDDWYVAPGTKHGIQPLRVVGTITADNGVGSTNTTSYKYKNFRSSPRRGPQGFESIEVTDPSGIVTTTTYAQAHPYTGMPIAVHKWKDGWLTQTTTELCDAVASPGEAPTCTPLSGSTTNPSGTPVFVYPRKVTDISFLRTTTDDLPEIASERVTVVSEFEYDAFGNPRVTTVTTSKSGGGQDCTGGTGGSGGGTGGTSGDDCVAEGHRKVIESSYGAQGGLAERRGKATQTAVTTIKLLGNVADSWIRHVTDFEYSADAKLALVKKKAESGRGVRLELHTAYAYDRFGNLKTVTECASDFDQCSAGAQGPVNPDPEGPPYQATDPNHPPFRTTSTSYLVGDFTPPEPAGSVGTNTSEGPPVIDTLDYTDGRFPVKTTNAEGHVQYSAYEPLLGVLVQTTGPNGVYTCSIHDRLGWKSSETTRCGSVHPLTTQFERYLALDNRGIPTETLVTVVRPPTNSTTWTFADALGRTVHTLSRSFEGGFIEAITNYDTLGRVVAASRPRKVPNQLYFAWTVYDDLGRISEVTQELGPMDGTVESPQPGVVKTRFTYNGSAVTTGTGPTGNERQRTETKNAMGKIESVEDADGVKITYEYNVEGALEYTHDPAGNTIHLTYDNRGRKITSSDPDLGEWHYRYNGFGDLILQTDAKNQMTAMTYDRLGRMTSKTHESGTDNAATAEWVYDAAGGGGIGKVAAMVSAPDSRLRAPCDEIPHVTQTSGNRSGRWFEYNAFGDLVTAYECTDGETFRTDYGYDDLGRQNLVRYPQVGDDRFAVTYSYSSLGYLHYVSDASSNKVLWQLKSLDEMGQPTGEQLANGVETVSKRSSGSGWLLRTTATSHADHDNLIYSGKFKFDEYGNLRSRMRSAPRDMADSVETFAYDHLDRLLSARTQVSGEGYDTTETYGYDALGLGNLVLKAGKTYSYTGCAAGGGPHAVCSVQGGPGFSYDPNGNMTAGDGRTVAYTPFNKASRIEGQHRGPGGSAATVDFVYGADDNRVVQQTGSTTGTELARTIYVGLGGTGKSIYERTTSTDGIEHVHFIYAAGLHGGSAFAMRVAKQTSAEAAPAFATKYAHFDHLGSVVAMSDENGQVLGPTWGGSNTTTYSYDAWGSKRNADGRPTTTYLGLATGHREYTGHETIPDVDLVNMNGRIYHPELGRFLSPDPNVQQVTDLQVYNRYSYVRNNPLRYTDPTGYSFLDNAFLTFATAVGFAAACAGTYGAGCAVFVAWSVFVAVEVQGASFGQTVLTTAVSMLAGQMAGAAVSGLDGGSAILAGAIAGGVSAAYTRVMLGQTDSLGETFLVGAALGAFSSAVAVGRRSYPVSEASAAEQQGGGGVDRGGRYLQRDPSEGPDWYSLSEEGRQHYGPLFDELGYDVDRARIHVGDSILNLGGMHRTFGDYIYLVGESWQALDSDQQLFLLGHELTHSMQWDQGWLTFGARYLLEEANFPQGQQYGLTNDLMSAPVNQIDWDTSLFSRMEYSLDELADRIGYQVAPNAAGMYQVKATSAYGY